MLQVKFLPHWHDSCKKMEIYGKLPATENTTSYEDYSGIWTTKALITQDSDQLYVDMREALTKTISLDDLTNALKARSNNRSPEITVFSINMTQRTLVGKSTNCPLANNVIHVGKEA